MGTGGNLPTTVTQTISLYNTTGVIEKEKNIYFCPFIAQDSSKTVRQVWLSKFKTAVSSYSEYLDITISNWNPKDRNLLIKGNADDFRAVNSLGYALNYLILERTVTTGNNTKVYMYAFFINDVSQQGLGSILLSLEPDDFTTAFYLNNVDTLDNTLTYQNGYLDVFNPKMKNNFVARQHYNRYGGTLVQEEVPYETTDFEVEINAQGVPPHITFLTEVTIDLTNLTGITPNYQLDVSEVVRVAGTYELLDVLFVIENVYVEDGHYMLYCTHTDSIYPQTPIKMKVTMGVKLVCKETNLDIFSQIEESFKYKRQFRDYHKWLNYGNPDALDFTEEELDDIEHNTAWNMLNNNLKLKIIKKCLAYYNVVVKSQAVFINTGDEAHMAFTPFDLPFENYPRTNIGKGLTNVIVPTFIVPDLLVNYKSNIADFFNQNVYIRYHSGNDTYELDANAVLTNVDYLSMYMSTLKDYIVSVYITKESVLKKYIDFQISPDNIPLMTIDCEDLGADENYANKYSMFACLPITNNEVTSGLDIFEGVINANNKETDNVVYFKRDIVERADGFYAVFTPRAKTGGQPFDVTDYLFMLGFVVNNELLSFNLDLSETNKTFEEVKTEFSDPVTTFNPYSFYGVSYLGRLESILNKVNYYEKPNIQVELVISVTDVLKYSILPIYELEGLKQRFFSEGLESTIANNIDIATESYTQYIIQNKAQMRNQYAVNESNLGFGIVRTTVTGGAGLGEKASMLGGWGALMGGIEATAHTINDAFSYGQATHETYITQKAQLADIGHLPSNLKQTGTDLFVDLSHEELGLYLNHYKIDTVSYNSICKYLERFGYMVNIYDDLHVNTRVGWDYLQLVSFDYKGRFTTEQEENIRQIFLNGVTLLHDENKLENGDHNYEVALE